MGNEQSRRRRSAHASDKVDATVINPDRLNITITGGYVYANLASLQVAVAPGSDTSLKVGQTARLHATGTYKDGSTGDVTGQVQWSSDNPNVVKVDTAGMATGESPGTATITGRLGSASPGQVTMTVGAPTPVGITGAPAPASRSSGASAPPMGGSTGRFLPRSPSGADARRIARS